MISTVIYDIPRLKQVMLQGYVNQCFEVIQVNVPKFYKPISIYYVNFKIPMLYQLIFLLFNSMLPSKLNKPVFQSCAFQYSEAIHESLFIVGQCMKHIGKSVSRQVNATNFELM